MPRLPRKRPFDDDDFFRTKFSDFFDEIDRAFDDAFKGFGFDDELWNNKDFQDELKKHGHVTYGYSARIGSDGKPNVKTWSNVDNPERFGFKPQLNNLLRTPSSKYLGESTPEQVDYDPYIEFLTDKETNVTRIIVDLPGIDKKDIKLKKKGHLLVLKASSEQRSYYKEILLHDEVETIKTTFKNGILEITVTPRKNKEPAETDIPID